MKQALAILAAEFAHAADAGVPRTVWWRDDDAVAPTPRLEALARIAAAAGAPLALAAIPTRVEGELFAWCEAAGVTLLQHGVAHENHERNGKPAELGAARPLEVIAEELTIARKVLEACPAFVPVLVPPWNRMRDDLAPLLAAAGWRGVSMFGAPARRHGLSRVDTHIDPIAWRADRSLLAADALAQMAADAVQTGGPIGLLTHHLVHDPRIDAFVEEFAALVASHPGATFASARELFG